MQLGIERKPFCKKLNKGERSRTGGYPAFKIGNSLENKDQNWKFSGMRIELPSWIQKLWQCLLWRHEAGTSCRSFRRRRSKCRRGWAAAATGRRDGEGGGRRDEWVERGGGERRAWPNGHEHAPSLLLHLNCLTCSLFRTQQLLEFRETKRRIWSWRNSGAKRNVYALVN